MEWGCGQPQQASGLGSALVHGSPGRSSCSSAGSFPRSVPALWPWVVALPLDRLQVLRLHPEEPLPGPRAALL